MSQVNVLRGQIGALPEYKVGADWSSYQERMEQYFLANYIEKDRKVAVLITAIGDEAYETLKGLCDPDLPKDKSYSVLCQLLKEQFTKKISVFKERVEFYDLKQFENEPIKIFYVRLKSKAIECKFGKNLNEVLKDRFVSALQRGPILDRVCEEEHTAELQVIIEVALKKEAALVQTRSFANVNAIAVLPKNKPSARKDTAWRQEGGQHQGTSPRERDINKMVGARCYSCGNGGHNFKTCKYKQFRCPICKRMGHLAKVCGNNTNNYVEPMTSLDEEEPNLDFVEMYFVTSNNFVKPIKVEMLMENRPLLMELDSGAGISVIPEAVYYSKFKDCKLNATNVRLKTYDGNVIAPLGEIFVTARYADISAKSRLIVIRNGSTPLLGRDLMSVFNFKIKKHEENVNTLSSDFDLDFLLEKYKDLFDGELGHYKYEKIELKVDPNCKPTFCRPRPVPFSFKEAMNKELEELEKRGVIELVDDSKWATPLVPVVKGNGKIRVCADYKVTVNRFMQDVKHPLPRIEELFAALQGGENFTKLDFANAYNQLELTETTKKLLCWSTHRGIYKPNRLPFGTKPACSIFQKIVEKVLLGIPGVINFLDDIVVTGRNREEHLGNLRSVFDKLSKAGFRLNLKKCDFFKPEIKYLGHIINKEGLHKDPGKIQAVMGCPRPQNVSEVRAYAGMVNYYGRFVSNLSTLLQPLYKLLRAGTDFKWSQECEKAFLESKEAICSDVSLAHFDPEITLKLVCDASNIGLGAVLLHVYSDNTEKPISFASRVLNKHEIRYSVIHKEALAIYWGVRKFYQYLMGKHFILCSDHKPLAALFGENKGIPQMAAGRLQRWALFLSGFSYTFKHIKGAENGAADGLSRMPLKITEHVEDELDYFNFLVEDNIPVSSSDIKKEIRSNVTLSTVYRYVRDGWPGEVSDELKPYARKAVELSIDNDIIMWGYRVIIPSKFHNQMLKELHAAHNGVVRMKSLARQYLWWPGLDSEIEKYVKDCDACRKNSINPPKACLIKFDEGKHVFDRIHIDFLGPFHGKTYLIITDSYSKWPEVYEMSKVDSLNTIQKLRDCFARFGLPNTIISDNGTQFVSEEFKTFCKNNGIVHLTSAPYHPSTNGAAENSVKSFKYALNKMLSDKSNAQDMNTLISKYLFSYRNTPHCVTGQTPSKLMFLRKIKTRFDFLSTPDVLKARERQIRFHRGNRMLQFEVGEKVYVKDYRSTVKPIWSKGIIIDVLGLQHYLCSPLDNQDLVWKRHLDQITKIGQFYETFPNEEAIKSSENPSSTQFPEILDKTPRICEQAMSSSVVPGSPEMNEERSSEVTIVDASVANAVQDEDAKSMMSTPTGICSSIKGRPRRQIKPPDRLNL